MKKLTKILILPLCALILTGCAFFGGDDSSSSSSTTSTTSEDTSSGSESSSSSTEVTPVYPTKIALPAAKEIPEGSSAVLQVTYTPNNTNRKTVTWTSSNEEYVPVSNGKVRGLKEGETAVITATAKDKDGNDLVATCNITVTEKAPLEKTEFLYNYDDYINYSAYTLSNCPNVGNPKVLIIPIWFTDSSSYITAAKKETVRSDIEKAYLGSASDTGWHSVKSFYQAESMGKLNLTGVCTDWYEINSSSTTYANGSESTTKELVKTATNAYFASAGADSRASFDTDHDGYLDAVLLIYGAPDYSARGSSIRNNLWAYCYWVQESGSVSSPKPNVFFWASYDFMYSSGTDATERSGKTYGSGNTSHCTIDAHTFIHEMGHVLGLEDYYDYNYSHGYSPAGGFSMQDRNVGAHDPYSVMAYGWADPYIPTESMTITIGAFQTNHDVIMLTNHNTKSPFDEYMLLELYTPTGLNAFDCTYDYGGGKGPSVPGIRLWHVDTRLYSYSTSSLTNNPKSNNVLHAFNNTSLSSPSDNRTCAYIQVTHDEQYVDYNMLHLIRNSTTENLNTTNRLTASNLFKEGDSYSQATYARQFPNGSKMNNKNDLGWSFTIESLDEESATITLTKA